MSITIADRTETLAPGVVTPKPAEPVEHPAAGPSGAPDDPERYDARGEHGRGGLGRVVRAFDKRLGRSVAVKELLKPSLPSDEARFLREALITARLEHPGIVPVHEAGRWPSGDPYYVMKLVEGRTLKALIAASDRDPLHLLPHLIAIADAVGYAHSQRVIHRDLKPSNVVIGEFGETIVVDWGLARDLRQPAQDPAALAPVTLAAASESRSSGNVVGTPAYMAPEQARGEEVDERADVYAIGAILYEILAGHPPHHDNTPQATLDRLLAGPPRPLLQSSPRTPRELATIVNKAMARDPNDRYPNATALAEDLRAFHTGKLVGAHSYSRFSLLRRKLTRHRGVVAVAAASAVALAAVGAMSFRKVIAERNLAQHSDALAQDARAQAERRQRELVLLQAETSLQKDPTAALAWLKSYQPLATDAAADRAHIQTVIDEAVALGVASAVFRTKTWALDAVFTPDRKRVIAGTRDGKIHIYELANGAAPHRALTAARGGIDTLTMSHGGDFVLAATMFGELVMVPLDGQPVRRLRDGDSRVLAVALSPDDRRALVTSERGGTEVIDLAGHPVWAQPSTLPIVDAVAADDWDRRVVASANQLVAVSPAGDRRTIAQLTTPAKHLALSPNGDHVVVHDGSALWVVPFDGTRKPIKLADFAAKIADIAWSPDGVTAAVGGDLHEIVIVDVVTARTTMLRGHNDAIYSLAWTRDGRRLLSASDDATARLWTVADGSAMVLRGHEDDVYHARLSRDDQAVVTASLDGSVRVWSLAANASQVWSEGARVDYLKLDGDQLTSMSATAIARWDLATGQRRELFGWPADHHNRATLSSDGKLVAVVDDQQNAIELRSVDGDRRSLRGHTAQITRLGFSRDGRELVSASRDGTVRRWEVASGTSTTLMNGTVVDHLAVSRDGTVVVAAAARLLWIGRDGAVRLLGSGAQWCVAGIDFEPITNRLVLWRCNGSLATWDRSGQVVELPSDGIQPTRIAASRDGTWLAGAMSDRTVRVWSVRDGHVERVLRGHSDLVLDVAFSPDGTRLASASYDKSVRVWDLATGRSRVLRGHDRAVNSVAWRDDRQLITGSRDGTIRAWQAPQLAAPSRDQLAAELASATTAQIVDDRLRSDAANDS